MDKSMLKEHREGICSVFIFELKSVFLNNLMGMIISSASGSLVYLWVMMPIDKWGKRLSTY